MKSQTLSSLMFGAPTKAFVIKDYNRVHQIFVLHLKNHFDAMSKEIYFYKASEFIVDLTVYLNQNYKHDNIRKFMAEDIMDEYSLREFKIKEEMALKQELKKMLL